MNLDDWLYQQEQNRINAPSEDQEFAPEPGSLADYDEDYETDLARDTELSWE